MLFSPATKAIIAAALALMIIVADFPLLLPWLFAFFAFDILAPANIVSSKWLLCAVAGILIGVAALWLDASGLFRSNDRPLVLAQCFATDPGLYTRSGSRRRYLFSRSRDGQVAV